MLSARWSAESGPSSIERQHDPVEVVISPTIKRADDDDRAKILQWHSSPPLNPVQVAVMHTPIGVAMAAKDVRDLQIRRHDRRRSRRGHDLNCQSIKWAIGLPDQTARDTGIARRAG